MKRLSWITLLAVVLTGCGVQLPADRTTETEAPMTEEAARSESPSETEANTQPKSDDWRTAYRSVLQEFMQSEQFVAKNADYVFNNGSAFSLYDMTGDGIPELILSPDYAHATGCYLYTYQDSLVRMGKMGAPEEEIGAFGEFYYEPETDVIMDTFYAQGETHIRFYRIENGALHELAKLYSYTGAFQQPVYHIYDKAVSEEAFTDVLHQYTGMDRVTLGRDYVCSEAMVDAVLTQSKDWRQTYRRLLEDYQDTGAAFSLRDINQDGIPELFLAEHNDTNAQCMVFSFADGLIALGEMGSFGEVGYDPERSLLIAYHLAQGYESSSLERMTEDLRLEAVLTYCNNIGAAPEEAWEFEINGDPVSKEAYDAALAEYEAYTEYATDYPKKKEWLGQEYPITESNIETAFLDFTEKKAAEHETRYIRQPEPWEQVYRTLLEPYSDTGAVFLLMDVSGDRTPELFLADEQHAQDSLCQMYTYTETDGLVYIGETDFGGEFCLNIMNGYFLQSICNDGYDFYSVQEVTNENTLHVVARLIQDESDGNPVWYIDEEEVSEEVFEAAYQEYGFDSDLIRLGLRHAVTVEEIDAAIRKSYAPPAF